MITLLTGDNSFESARALENIVSSFDGVAEKVDGISVSITQLPDLLMGATLFADKRLVIINDLSENKPLWDVLPNWLERVGDDIHLVLAEQKPDKRTKTFKELKKSAIVKEFTSWSDRDVALAVPWAIAEANRIGFVLDKGSAQMLVHRVGVDQWQLHNALQKLSVLEAVNPAVIENIIEATPSENVFNLFDAALRRDTRKIMEMIITLQRTQDPYMTFGLLSSQVFQFAALAVADKPAPAVAGDIGAHPYALSKLAPHAKKLGPVVVRKIAHYFADADSAMKSSATDPWILIEEALIKTASV